MLTPKVLNNRKLRVFKPSDTVFTSNGLGVLFDADMVKVHMQLDGLRTLEFQLDYNSPSWGLIKHGNLVLCEGQLYRVRVLDRKNSGDVPCSVLCYHVFADAAKKYVPIFKEINKPPIDILTSVFSGHPRFHVMTATEVANLGMTWITDVVYLAETGDVSAGDIISQVFHYLEKGELYIDNWNIALVERVGVNKGVRVSDTVNSQAINEVSDDTDLINVAYVYGKDNIPLDATAYPNSILRSQTSIDLFGEREGAFRYETIDDKAILLAKAQYEFSSSNELRKDMPKSSVTVTYIDLGKMYQEYPNLGVGDTVIVPARLTTGTYTNPRITGIDYYPLSPENSSITLGDPPRTLTNILAASVITGSSLARITNTSGEVKPDWLANIQRTLSTYVNATLKRLQAVEHKTGDIWLDPLNPNLALAIIGGNLAIANSKGPDGDWLWTSFGDGNGFTANIINAGTLNTNKVVIQDNASYMQLAASFLKMYYSKDPNGVVANDKLGFVVGKDTDGKFKFQINDKDGSPKIYMDSTGQIIIDGKLGANAVLTDGLYARSGNISDITVDRLESANKVPRYLRADKTDMLFTRIQDNWIYFINATTTGTTTVQLTNRKGDLVYWQQNIAGAPLDSDGYPLIGGSRVLTTTTNTGFPVTVYTYTESIKGSIGFDSSGNVIQTWGVGTDVNNQTYGKAKMFKDQTGANLIYTTSTGIPRGFILDDNKVDYVGADNMVAKIRSDNNQPLVVQSGTVFPSNPVDGQLFLLKS